jgi:hypothetical protein
MFITTIEKEKEDMMNTLQKICVVTTLVGLVGSGYEAIRYNEFFQQKKAEWHLLTAANPSLELVSEIRYQERISAYLRELASSPNPHLPLSTRTPKNQEEKTRVIDQLATLSDSIAVEIEKMKQKIEPSNLEETTNTYKNFVQQQKEKEMRIFPYFFLFPVLTAAGVVVLANSYEHNNPG